MNTFTNSHQPPNGTTSLCPRTHHFGGPPLLDVLRAIVVGQDVPIGLFCFCVVLLDFPQQIVTWVCLYTEKSYNKLNIVPLFSLQTLVRLAYRYFKYFCPQHIHDVENKESLLMHLLVFWVGYYNLHLSWEFKNSFHIQILDFEKSKALISYWIWCTFIHKCISKRKERLLWNDKLFFLTSKPCILLRRPRYSPFSAFSEKNSAKDFLYSSFMP